MLNGQAPIVYADDVENSLVDSAVEESVRNDMDLNDSSVKQILKMLGSPRSIPPYDNMFIDVGFEPDVADDEQLKTLVAVSDAIEQSASKEVIEQHVQKKMSEVKKRLRYTTSGLAAFVQTDPLRYLFPKNYDQVQEQLCLFYARSFLGMKRLTEGMTREQVDSFHPLEDEDPEFQEQVARFRKLKFVGIYPYLYNEQPAVGNTPTVHGPWGLSIYLLDENYKIMMVPGAPPGSNMLCHFDFKDFQDKNTDMFEKAKMISSTFSDRIVAIVVQTISLLNCSNVRLVETGKTNQDKTKKQLLTERLVSVRHHELRVKVGEQLVRVDGRTESGEKLCPLHAVRGHFRDYSQGKGMFGKYKYNCVWVPQFVRGNVEDGIVTRDYVLETQDGK